MQKITRRHLLRLAGAASATAALAGAVRAEGSSLSILPIYEGLFATSTPLHVGAVTLRARDLEAMTRFYADIIGLSVMENTGSGVSMGVDGVTLLMLEHTPEAAFAPVNAAGLYHTAFLMPSRADLAAWLVHTAMAQYPFTGFADHLVSEAVYLDDPEGNGVEVYADRPPELWSWSGDTVAMASDPIDFDSLLALADTSLDTYDTAPRSMRIGHIHLRAGDIDMARAFYKDALGLDVVRERSGAIFLSSGRYHHHVALNIWQSQGAGQRDASHTGLAELTLIAADNAIAEATRTRLFAAGADLSEEAGSVLPTDPWGTRLRIRTA